MNVGFPLGDAIPGAHGRLLATLAQLEKPVSVRALARYSGTSPQTALSIVNDLSDTGLVAAERIGTALTVALNRDHILADPVIMIAMSRARLIEKLTRELAGWSTLAGAWLFGSAARGDGDRHSDIDLLLVAGTSITTALWAQHLARLVGQVHAWTGNEAQLVEHTTRSFAQLVRSDNSLIANLRLEGIALRPRSRDLLRRGT